MKCECGSKFGYVRINGQQWVCRNCGKITEMPSLKKIAKNFAGLNQ